MKIATITNKDDWERWGKQWLEHHKGNDLIICADFEMNEMANIIKYRPGSRGFSFAEMRNEVLKNTDGDVVFVDTDERLLVPADKEADGVVYNIISHAKDTTFLHRAIRGVNSKYRYTGFCHERVAPDIEAKGGEIYESHGIIEHFGYLDTRGKKERNLLLLCKELIYGDKEYALSEIKRTIC